MGETVYMKLFLNTLSNALSNVLLNVLLSVYRNVWDSNRSLPILILAIFSIVSPAVSLAEAPKTVVGAETIGLERALDLYHKGAVFIDVRDKESWKYGHIEGAVHLDFNDDEFVILYVSDALDKETPIVFYCDSPLSTTGAMASFFAASWGYENVHFFREGYYAWLASDMPMQLYDQNETAHVAMTSPASDISVAGGSQPVNDGL